MIICDHDYVSDGKTVKFTRYSIFYQDPHGELDIEHAARTSGLELEVVSIYHPYLLEDVGAGKCLEVFTELANRHDECDPEVVDWAELYAISGTKDAHHVFAYHLVSEIIEWLNKEPFGGDDTYFDYFPNTAESIVNYIRAVSSATGETLAHYIQPLVHAICAEGSPYYGDETDVDLVNTAKGWLE